MKYETLNFELTGAVATITLHRLDAANAFNQQIAERIQELVTSPGFRGMPLNYREQRICHRHAELDRRIGVERVREHLRVEPVLDAYATDGWQ